MEKGGDGSDPATRHHRSRGCGSAADGAGNTLAAQPQKQGHRSEGVEPGADQSPDEGARLECAAYQTVARKTVPSAATCAPTACPLQEVLMSEVKWRRFIMLDRLCYRLECFSNGYRYNIHEVGQLALGVGPWRFRFGQRCPEGGPTAYFPPLFGRSIRDENAFC